MVDKVWSDWVSHQSDSGEEEEEDAEKEYEAKLENKVMEGNVGRR